MIYLRLGVCYKYKVSYLVSSLCIYALLLPSFLETKSFTKIKLSINKNIVGFWELSRTHDLARDETHRPSKKVYYDFHEDNTLTITDTVSRERSYWGWKVINNSKLIIWAEDIYIEGIVTNFTKTSLSYKLTSSKSAYIWFFDKIE